MFGVSRKVNTDPQAIKKLLTQGVEEVFVRESLEQKLLKGKPLRIKLGFDPTGPRIHIGRAIVLRKLREFQNLGHTAVFVIGDMTARIGDSSDKLEKRPMLTDVEIKKNLTTYKQQVSKILDVSRAEFHYNSRWLSKLDFTHVAELAESFSVPQMMARRNFKERMDKGDEVSLREFLYPLMQGYDSVAVRADVEIGGFDQLFNLKAGRTIQKHYNQPQQDILTTVMLEGTDGRKMSTSWGNIIAITDKSDDMFGKVMSIKDDLLIKYFALCTDVSETDREEITKGLSSKSLNPRDAKIRLAREIVTLYHGGVAAQKAERQFINTFSKSEFPTDTGVRKIKKGTPITDAVSDVVGSKSEFVRLLVEGAVFDYKTNTKITDRKMLVDRNFDLRIGKHRFVRIVVSE